jgi:peptide/nickel transport system ATP-binding protein
MGDRLAVMRRGEIVERLDVGQLRRGEADHPYTRQLLIAAKGYDRQLADTLLE